MDSEPGGCGACDVCLGELNAVEDATTVARKIVACVARLDQRYGSGHVVDVLRGGNTQRIRDNGHDALSTYALLREKAAPVLRSYIDQLVDQDLLARSHDEYKVLRLTERGVSLMKGEGEARLIEPKMAKQAPKSAPTRDSADWEGVDQALFDALRTLRREIAGEMGVPAYIVFGDTTLRAMARDRPTDLRAIGRVKGVGAKKLESFGERFVALISEHAQSNAGA